MQPYHSVWTDLFRTGFRHDWLDAGGVRTRFLEAGPKDAPVLLFLHGTGGSLEAFCANIAAHAKHFRCLAIDMLGSGQTDKPDHAYEIPLYADHVRDFLDAMQVRQASLCGVSLGAWVCAQFALTYPQRTRKLTLLSASGLVANPNTMKQIRSLRSSAVDNPSWDNIRAVMENLVHRKDVLIDDLVAVRQAIYGQPGMQQAMSNTLCLQVPEVRARNLLSEAEWRAIKAPALVVGALEDNPDYLGTARAVADLMPDARYVEIPDVAHWPQFEASETFNRLSIEFLRS